MKITDNQRQADQMENKYAWAAGFFDGEGSVCILSSPPSYRLYAKLTQVDPIGTIELQKMFGGALYKNIRTRVRVTGTTVKEIYWDWCLVGDKAKVALEKMLPYLTLKKSRAELGIKYQELVNNGRRATKRYRLSDSEKQERTDYYFKMKTLNASPTAADRAAAETKSKEASLTLCDSPTYVQ